jgi:hypothetical protein
MAAALLSFVPFFVTPSFTQAYARAMQASPFGARTVLLWVLAASSCATAARSPFGHFCRDHDHHHHTADASDAAALTDLAARMDTPAQRTQCMRTRAGNEAGGPANEEAPPPPLVFESVGGWGDQVRGLVTAHYVALMTCRPLKVHWTRPFSLGAYFDAALDYAPAREAAQAAHVVSQVDTYAFFREEANLARLAAPTNASTVLRTNAYQWLEVCRHPGFRPTAEHHGLAGLTRYDLFVLGLRALLPRPAPHMRRSVNKLLGRDLHAPITFGTRRVLGPTSSAPVTIGVQIRTGGVGSGWADPARYPLSSVACYVTEVRRLCSGGRPCTVFLTTDSGLASAKFKEALGPLPVRVLEWQGSILHTDRPIPTTTPPPTATGTSTANTADVWEKTFLDWTTLSQVDVLLMSRSGFAWTAAWAGTVPYVRELGLCGGECAWRDFDRSDPLELEAGPCKT